MANIPRIGQLDRRIEIQESTELRSATGSRTLEWTAVARCWAGVEHANTGNNEQVAGDQPVATTRIKFIIRYRSGLTENMRILYNSEYYDMLPPFEHLGRGNDGYLVIPAQKQV